MYLFYSINQRISTLKKEKLNKEWNNHGFILANTILKYYREIKSVLKSDTKKRITSRAEKDVSDIRNKDKKNKDDIFYF